MPPPTKRIAIIGGGVAGLACATALLKYGVEVAIYEQAPELPESGAGVQLSPNATRALASLGTLDELAHTAVATRSKVVRVWNTGETRHVQRLNAACFSDAPYLTVARRDLARTLAEAVKRASPDSLRLARRCVGVRQVAGFAEILFAEGPTESATLVIGADGVHSAVRTSWTTLDSPRFSGMVAWRAVVDARRLNDSLLDPVAVNWIGPTGHIVHYPIESGARLNLVAVTKDQQWDAVTWSAPGNVKRLRQYFRTWHPLVIDLLGEVQNSSRWALMERAAPSAWWNGCVVLIGDACHPMLPFLAQGACAAIEDGVVLARALAIPGLSMPDALRRFQAARQARVARLVSESAANAARFHSSDLAEPHSAALHLADHWRGDRVDERYGWIYAYDAATATL